MADQKITQLSENTTPITTDVLPMVDDPAGTPATQKVTIANLMSTGVLNNPYKFSVYKNTGTQTVNTGADTKVTFDTVLFDTGNNFGSSIYTIPVNGFYFFSAAAGYNAVASGARFALKIYKNGAAFYRGDDRFDNALNGTATVNCLMQCAAADTIELYAVPVGANTQINAHDTNPDTTRFQGFLISIT